MALIALIVTPIYNINNDFIVPNKKVIKKFIYYVVDHTPSITFIAMLVCDHFII